MTKPWLSELKRELKSQSKSVVVKPMRYAAEGQLESQIIRKKTGNTTTSLLIIVALVLSIAISLAWVKHVKASQQLREANATEVKYDAPQEQPTQAISEPTAQMRSVEAKVDALVKRDKETQRKIWMLGVLHNNNFSEVSKYVPGSNPVKIQTDWIISGELTHVELTDEQTKTLTTVTEL